MPVATLSATAASRPADAGRLIVALDLPTVRAADALVERLAELRPMFKIGHQLAYTGGLDLATRLIGRGYEVFLDLKLHDIPRTVEEGVRSLAGLGATFLTVHGYPQTVRAAVAGRGSSGLKILGVTVLTSMDDRDAQEAGYASNVVDLVALRARDGAAAGLEGLVCAPTEISALRGLIDPDMLLVVPGTRPAGADAGDQKRVRLPGEAMRDGADYLVMGRPITGASDPAAAAHAILREMAGEGRVR